MHTETRHSANRIAWNEAAARYKREIQDDIAFLKAGGKNLMEPELRILKGLGSWCHRAIHLQCAGGRDTLSLWNQGAKEVIGVNISDKMIECAKQKSDALNAPAQWVVADVLKTPHHLDGTADLVYTGRGAVLWIMDIEEWAKVIKRLLKPNGLLYMFEGHPMDWVWCPNSPGLATDESYFSEFINESFGWPEGYIKKGELPEKLSAKYGRQWTLGKIVTDLAKTGLHLEILEEYALEYYDIYPNIPREDFDRLPHTFSLVMRNLP